LYKLWLNLLAYIFLKVHKREKFFGSDFEFFTILKLVKLKYLGFVKKNFDSAIIMGDRLFRLY